MTFWKKCMGQKGWKSLLNSIFSRRIMAETCRRLQVWDGNPLYNNCYHRFPRHTPHHHPLASCRKNRRHALCPITTYISNSITWLTYSVKVLHPTWHKIGHYGEAVPSQPWGQYTPRTTVLWLFGFCPGQPGWASTRRNIHPLTLIVVINHPYLLPPSTTIHGILPIQSTCFTVFFHNLSPSFLWSTSWPATWG